MKHTTDPTDKENLRTALDAMRVSGRQCVSSRRLSAFLSFLPHFPPPLCVAGLGAERERGEARQRDHQADHHVPAVHRKHGEVQARAPSVRACVFPLVGPACASPLPSTLHRSDTVAGALRPAQDRRGAEDQQPGEEVQTGQVRDVRLCSRLLLLHVSTRGTSRFFFTVDCAKRFETPLDVVRLLCQILF